MNRVIFNSILISCLMLAACSKKQPPANPEVPVNLYKAKEQKVLYYDKYPATTAALSQVNLLPQIQGAVTAVFFTEGQMVTKGQKLYEIDKSIYQANYDAAVANQRVAEGNLTQAQQDAERYEYLNKYNAVAKQLYDHAMITLQNSKNQVKSAEEAVKTAKTNLGYAIVYAPFSGTIGFSQVKIGNVVTPGSTVLNTISTDSPMAVDFVINEKQLPKFERLESGKGGDIADKGGKPGKGDKGAKNGKADKADNAVKLEKDAKDGKGDKMAKAGKGGNTPLPDSLFTLLLPDGSLYPGIGKLSIIDRAVDSQTGSIRVRLVFDNPNHNLKVGMSCVVRVHNQDTKPQVVLPNKAVIEQMGEYFVFVATDTLVNNPKMGKDSATKKMKTILAHQKKVMTGQTIGPNVVIKSGISAGDRVIVDGLQSLHDGSKITTANKVGPGGGGGRGK